MREPEHHGNPAPGSNAVIWLDFDADVAQGRRGIDVMDKDLVASHLIIQSGEDFAVNTVFHLGGSLAVSWFKNYGFDFTIAYHAEPMTGGGGNVQLGAINILSTNFSSLKTGPDGPYLEYDESKTSVTVAPDRLLKGLYRLTALASFTERQCPLPFNAYITGPVLEVAAEVPHN